MIHAKFQANSGFLLKQHFCSKNIENFAKFHNSLKIPQMLPNFKLLQNYSIQKSNFVIILHPSYVHEDKNVIWLL
jgi:hypothetical protein